jgi:hypothetical protein
MNKARNEIAKIVHPSFGLAEDETMTYKLYSICTKVTIGCLMLLILQPVFGQQKFNDLDDKQVVDGRVGNDFRG